MRLWSIILNLPSHHCICVGRRQDCSNQHVCCINHHPLRKCSWSLKWRWRPGDCQWLDQTTYSDVGVRQIDRAVEQLQCTMVEACSCIQNCSEWDNPPPPHTHTHIYDVREFCLSVGPYIYNTIVYKCSANLRSTFNWWLQLWRYVFCTVFVLTNKLFANSVF